MNRHFCHLCSSTGNGQRWSKGQISSRKDGGIRRTWLNKMAKGPLWTEETPHLLEKTDGKWLLRLCSVTVRPHSYQRCQFCPPIRGPIRSEECIGFQAPARHLCDYLSGVHQRLARQASGVRHQISTSAANGSVTPELTGEGEGEANK